jgi:beta-mannosidase
VTHDRGAPAHAAVVTTLTSGWSLHQERRSAAAPEVPPVAAQVPGCVHTDLLAAGLIPDPLVGINEVDAAWVADCDWRYRCEVEVADEHMRHDHVELKFHGLDTLATVSVNGEVVGETANMHRRYRFDVGHLLHPGTNQLDVVFRSATRYCDQVRADEGEWPSASFGRPFNYLRKMACSWGWDWGPQLTTAGIWRPVNLEAWTVARLSDVRTRTTISDGELATLDIDADVVTGTRSDLRLRTTLVDPDGAEIGTTTVPVALGTTRATVDAGAIRRWWPHTLGDQPLYELAVEVLDPDDVVHASRRLRIGFRTIDLDTSLDDTGSAFTFVVNGRAMFVRGVNWIPDDVFPSRVDADRYSVRIGQAIDANVDLLRVWGGGVYEDDAFFEICDERGVLVWQDFAFACAAYPEHLLADEVEAEAYGNVSRLMHHPSLAIWNGNNENLWGYWDWGWQDQLGDRPWGAGFYHDLLPRICAELDPDRPYWPGSPWSGSDDVAPNADAHGCVHVWDVWNELDLTRYRDHTPRFVAEFGWQAPPSVRTLEDAIGPRGLHRDSPAWRSHQKAADGDAKLDRGIVARFGRVDDFEAFCYAAHVVQARAVRAGIEHFRSLRPWCMGTIWWQLNDCWPATSWSVIDGAGRRKPAWHALRQAYRARLLTIQPRGDRLVVFALNETGETWRVDTEVVRRRFDGRRCADEPVRLAVPAGGQAAHTIDRAVATATDATDEVLTVGDGPDRGWWWYERDVPMPATTLEWTWRTADDSGAGSIDGRADELVLTVVADRVVRELTIHPERIRPSAVVDRQLIDLLPGEPAELRIRGLDIGDVERLLRPPSCWHAAALAGWIANRSAGRDVLARDTLIPPPESSPS